MDIPLSTYNFKNVGYNLESILLFYQSNRIDTDLDCQRGYVWTSEQKQQLIDTLINRERIPEFHVIKEADEAIFHFADGKQRITTILKFLSGELNWEKGQADPKFKELFNKANKLSFTDLPENFQNMILNTELSFACYSNMTPASTTKLFRKLNSGTALGEFQKGLAENITIKQYFLNSLMSHPVIQKIFSVSKIEKGNAEQALIRLMILMKNLDDNIQLECDLTPPNLKHYYLNLETATEEESYQWIHILDIYQKKIKKYLDWLNTYTNLNLTTRSDYVFLFSIFFTYKNNGDEEYLKMIFETLNGINAGTIVGSGSDYSKTNIKKYIDYISKIA